MSDSDDVHSQFSHPFTGELVRICKTNSVSDCVWKVSKNVDKWLWMLSGSRIMTRGQGDCNVVKSKSGSVEGDFKAWKSTFLSRLQALVRGEKQACSGDCKKGKCKNKKHQHREENEQNAGTQEEHSSEVRLTDKITAAFHFLNVALMKAVG